MPTYRVWYKKEVKAKNIKEAIHKEPQVKLEFYSIEEEKENKRELTSCIGFEVYNDI